ncbi:hypothetical protein DFR74_107244 [Nocardia puris]|uniref:Uncharacterized protein n=1 Tax=Nocardia puris TaxID=208602 RepID=A0A366DHT7_9NOCA|nr:hypothetical protein DFR74_107244 [Nocardia puris]
MGEGEDGGAGVGVFAEGFPYAVGGALVQGGGRAVGDEDGGGGGAGGALDLARGVVPRQQVPRLGGVKGCGASLFDGP